MKMLSLAWFRTHKKSILYVLILTLIASVLDLRSARASSAFFQSPENPWETPVNLSHSGGASNPQIVVDDGGGVHVVWEDLFEQRFAYSFFDGTAWSSPVVADFPFGIYPPRLFAGRNGLIHAFWIDDQNNLFYSRVRARSFGNPFNWESSILLAVSALVVDVAADGQDSIHLAYVRNQQTADFRAGIYYLNSKDNGSSWTLPVSVYQSSYFRGLTSADASVSIASVGSAEPTRVYLAWDNRARKQVFLATSRDGGDTWDTPVEIDKPDETAGSESPYQIQVAASNENLLLLWRTGISNTSCTQKYQWSADGGDTWSATQTMLEGISGCVQDNQFFIGKDNLIILLTSIQEQLFLLAWNGKQWSDPQSQPMINSFVDPETFDAVNYRCRQAAFVPEQDRFLIVGCDSGTGGDIWLVSRLLGSVEPWFPLPGAWSVPVLFASTQSEVQTPLLVDGPDDRRHVFWVQPIEGNPTVPQMAIHYTGWDGQRWTPPAAILGSPQGDTTQPAVTLDPAGVLYAVWSGGEPRGIYFNWANASGAYSSAEWKTPVLLPAPRPGGSFPSIVVDRSGMISVAYALPFNEGRGIYLTQSTDRGATWSEAVRVFDGRAAAWEMVGRTSLVSTPDGALHLHWARGGMPVEETATGLFYSRSVDGGQTWSVPEVVAETQVAWWQAVEAGGMILHRIWTENSSGRQVLKHQFSSDSGQSWSQAANISLQFGASGLVSLAAGSIGQPHLLQVVGSSFGRETLEVLSWNGELWGIGESLEISAEESRHINALAAAVFPGGVLDIIYTERSVSRQGSVVQVDFFLTSRSQGPEESTPGQPALIETPVGGSEATVGPDAGLTATQTVMSSTAIPTQGSTPTLDLAQLAPPAPQGNYTGLILGGTLGGLLVLIIFVIRILSVRFFR